MSNQPNNRKRWKKVAAIIATVGVIITILNEGFDVIDKIWDIIEPRNEQGDRSQISKPEIVDPGDPPPATPDSSQIDGVWDVRITTTQEISQDGFIDDYKSFADYVIIFESVGNVITGKLIGARGPGNPCSEGKINGIIDGSNVEYTLQNHGSCCSGERTKFTGNISEDGNLLIGKDEPVGIPTTNCSMWWADVVGKKRTQN